MSDNYKLSELINKVQQLKSENSSLKTLNVSLKSENSSLKTLNVSLKSENSSKSAEIIQLKALNSRLTMDNTKITSDCDMARKNSVSMAREKQEYQNKCSELTKEVNQYKNLASRNICRFCNR